MEKENRDKVVKQNLRVDFHIHSAASKHKDGDKVSTNTIENLHVLINKLIENELDMISISDHDCFDYNLYTKLKEKELDGTFKKVFPAIEFSIRFNNPQKKDSIIHVVCIFDDSNEEKVKQINSCLTNDGGDIDYDQPNSFSEQKFLSILRDINLDVVMIAHQKGSITSKSAEKNDIVNVGKWRLNEFISSEFFDSFEFRNPTNGIFNNLYKKTVNEKYEVVRFITGSDCHNWSVYPQTDDNDAECDFRHTYLKCLPLFKGLAMSLTDDSRISLNKNSFSIDNKKIDHIELTNSNKPLKIPLSHGINVIIGDNSIGKSMLLHKLTNFNNLVTTGDILNGYKKYLTKKNLDIKTNISKNVIYAFDEQGAIRRNFSSDEPGYSNVFLSSKYPDDLLAESYIQHIINELNNFYKKIEVKLQFDEKINQLITIPIITENIKEKHLSAIPYNLNLTSLIAEKNKVKIMLEATISKIEALILTKISDQEKTYLSTVLEFLSMMKKKYLKEHTDLVHKKSLINTINLGISEFNEYMKDYKSDVQNQIDKQEESINSISKTISELFNLKDEISSYEYAIEEKTIDVAVEKYGKYNFVKRFSCKKKVIDNVFYKEIISKALIKNKIIDTSTVTKKEIYDSIINKKEEEKNIDPFQLLKNRINSILNCEFQCTSNILHKDKDVTDTLSHGLNSTMYFDIISHDKTEGIYLVDQPEDDISQSGIRESIIDDFKSMRSKRQVILVTHNPQFVINLDADNVICIEQDKDGNIVFKSGALEYSDSDTDILQLVLDHLDGGLESIRKRWKRYEKNIEVNEE